MTVPRRASLGSILLCLYASCAWILVSAAMVWLFWEYVPYYASLLAETGADLPLDVRIVIASSNSVVRYLPFAIVLGPPLGGLLLVAAVVAVGAGRLQFLLRAMTPVLLAAALIEMVVCGHVVRTMHFVIPKTFAHRIEPATSFRFQGSLRCQAVVSTIPGFVSGSFELRDADTPSVEVRYNPSTSGRRMTRIHDDPDRSVFQLTDEDPGSVDTLSLDKANGSFVRMWSGWSSGQHALSAGGVRGRCEEAAPDATAPTR